MKLKLSFVVLQVMVFFCTSVWAGKIGMSDEQLAIWQRMKTENHKLYQDLVAKANTTNLYEDFGLRDGLMYLLTNDQKWAVDAFNTTVGYWRGKNFWRTDKSVPTSNDTRHQFIRMVILYDWIKTGLPEDKRKGFRDILDYWADLVLGLVNADHHTFLNDSDETTGHYFGLMLYALAISGENAAQSDALINHPGKSPSIKPVGGFTSTYAQNGGYSTWRNAIAMYCTKAKGGEWIESSEYNPMSVQYMMMGVTFINEYLGYDVFPECTAILPDMADMFVNQMTSDLKDSHQWGDVELPRNPELFNRIGAISMLAKITENENAAWLLDEFWKRNGTSNVNPYWITMVDPYLGKAAPAGTTYHLAEGVGTLTFHAGWGAQDSFFMAQIKPLLGVDHETDMFSAFRLRRKGGWAINNPIGYPGHPDLEAPYQNTVLVNGALPFVTQESKKFNDSIIGPDYAVIWGSVSGQNYARGSRKTTMTVTLKKYIRTIVYKHQADGSDIILTIDDLDAVNPLTLSSTEFDKFHTVAKDRIRQASGRHQILIHMPNVPTINGRDISWIAENGETVYLRTFVQDFDTRLINLATNGFGGDYDASEKKYQLRIIPKSTAAVQVLHNLYKVGSPITEQDYEIALDLLNQDPPCQKTSCDAPEPACEQISNGIDNCGNPCQKQGGQCPCIEDQKTCNALPPMCEEITEGTNNCGLPCTKIGDECPPIVQEVTVTITEFKKKTAYYIGLLNNPETRLFVTYYGKKYEVLKK